MPSGNDTRLVAKAAGLSMVGKFGGRTLHILGQVILARYLGPGLFGRYAIGWTMFRVVSLIAPLGLDRAVLRFAAGGRASGERVVKGVVQDSLLLALASAVVVAASMWLTAPWLAEDLFRKPELEGVLRGFAIAVVFGVGLRVSVATTWTAQTVRYGVLSEDLGQPAVNLLLIVTMAVLGGGLAWAVGAAAVSFGVASIAAGYFVFRLYRWIFDRQIPAIHTPRRLVAFSIPAVLAGAMPRFIAWTDRMVVGVMRPESEMGVYQAVSQATVVFSVMLAAIGGGIVGPMMARLYSEGEHERLRELFRVTTKWGLYAALPVFLLMNLMPSTLLHVVYGSEYVDGALPLMLLAWAGLLNAGTGSVGLLLVMTGHEKSWFLITSATLALDVALQGLLTPRWGLPGAALSTGIATGLMFSAGIATAALRLRLWPYDRRYLKGLGAAVVTAGVLAMIAVAPAIGETTRLLLACVVAVGVFPLVVWRAGLEAEDRELIAVIWRRMDRSTSGRQQESQEKDDFNE